MKEEIAGIEPKSVKMSHYWIGPPPDGLPIGRGSVLDIRTKFTLGVKLFIREDHNDKLMVFERKR